MVPFNTMGEPSVGAPPTFVSTSLYSPSPRLIPADNVVGVGNAHSRHAGAGGIAVAHADGTPKPATVTSVRTVVTNPLMYALLIT